MESIEIAKFAARVAFEKRATDILVLKMTEVLGVSEYFVFATGKNKRQLAAIGETIRLDLKAKGVREGHTEGYGSDRWVLLDYGSVVIHLFDAETRAFYDLESLWADAPRVSLPKFAEVPEAMPEVSEEDSPA